MGSEMCIRDSVGGLCAAVAALRAAGGVERARRGAAVAQALDGVAGAEGDVWAVACEREARALLNDALELLPARALVGLALPPLPPPPPTGAQPTAPGDAAAHAAMPSLPPPAMPGTGSTAIVAAHAAAAAAVSAVSGSARVCALPVLAACFFGAAAGGTLAPGLSLIHI